MNLRVLEDCKIMTRATLLKANGTNSYEHAKISAYIRGKYGSFAQIQRGFMS